MIYCVELLKSTFEGTMFIFDIYIYIYVHT